MLNDKLYLFCVKVNFVEFLRISLQYLIFLNISDSDYSIIQMIKNIYTYLRKI